MSIHEECGVFGVIAAEPTDVAGVRYYGLYALQHRGQESCEYCSACFDGDYPTQVPTDTRKDRFEQRLSQTHKAN